MHAKTSNKNALVDVLAVLDALELQTRRNGGSPSCVTIAEARAAVAELIATLERADEWIREAKNSGCRLPADNTLRDNRAALARCKGGAA